MSSIVYVGGTSRLLVNFQEWDNSATPSIEDPSTVNVLITDADDNALVNTTPSRLAVAQYYYDWTVPAPGTYEVKFTGTFPVETQVVATQLQAISPSPGTTQTLEEDQYLEFFVNISPMYVDPYDIQTIYPSVSLVEIADLVYQFSQEANEITGISNLASADFPPEGMSQMIQAPYPSVTPFIREFVQANVLCSLSRIYDIGQGADDIQIMLADLQVTRRSTIKDKVTRTTATTWCELAGVLRDELYRTTKFSGMRAVMRGEKSGPNPIPDRHVKHQEWNSYTPGRPWTRGNKFGSGWYN